MQQSGKVILKKENCKMKHSSRIMYHKTQNVCGETLDDEIEKSISEIHQSALNLSKGTKYLYDDLEEMKISLTNGISTSCYSQHSENEDNDQSERLVIELLTSYYQHEFCLM